jgi:hypothetical protein
MRAVTNVNGITAETSSRVKPICGVFGDAKGFHHLPEGQRCRERHWMMLATGLPARLKAALMESQTAKARNHSQDAEALLHSEAPSYKPSTAKSKGACEWGRWGRLSEDGPGHYNPDRSEGPWGRETSSLARRCFFQGVSRLDRGQGCRKRSAKDERKPRDGMGMPGAGLTGTIHGKASSDKPALKPYWGVQRC